MESTIIISSRVWNCINNGGSYSHDSKTCYEGEKFKVTWEFENKRFSIWGDDAAHYIVEEPVEESIINKT